MGLYQSTKVISLGSCAFRQWKATHSHCSKVHGYELRAKFYFGGDFLDNRNWIVDFGDLDELKKILNTIFDHTFCVAQDDPCLEDFKQLHEKGAIDLRIFENGVGIERTAELCFNVATDFLNKRFGDLRWVEKVEVFEHDKNSAIYINPRFVEPGVLTTTSPEVAEQLVQTYLKQEAAEQLKHTQQLIEEIKDESQPGAAPQANNAAPVGPVSTTGNYSGLFAGTRWG